MRLPDSGRLAFIIFTETLSRFTFCYFLRNGEKNAKNILSALESLVCDWAFQFPNVSLKTLGFDKEPGLGEYWVTKFLKDNKIDLQYRSGRVKSGLAEKMVGELKKQMHRLEKIQGKGNKKKSSIAFSTLMTQAVELLNERNLRIDGKVTGFTSASLQDTTLANRYIKMLERKKPQVYFSKFRIPDKVKIRK